MMSLWKVKAMKSHYEYAEEFTQKVELSLLFNHWVSDFTNNLRTIQVTKVLGGNSSYLYMKNYYMLHFSANNSIGWINKHCHRNTEFF